MGGWGLSSAKRDVAVGSVLVADLVAQSHSARRPTLLVRHGHERGSSSFSRLGH